MARMRYIKPTFWTDSTMVRLSRDARLFYIGTWCFTLCDEGHLEDDVIALKMQIFPADDVDCSALLDELVAAGRIVREAYINTTGGTETMLRVAHLGEHQKVEARWKPRCPACQAANPAPANPADTLPTPTNLSQPLPNSPKLSETLPTSTNLSPGGEGRGGDGIGEEGIGEVRSPRKRGTRIPDGFAPDDDMLAWAAANTPRLDVTAMTDEFIDYWRGVPGAKGVKLDWIGTWRNHMRRRQEWHDERGTSRPSSRDDEPVDRSPNITELRLAGLLNEEPRPAARGYYAALTAGRPRPTAPTSLPAEPEAGSR